MKNKSFDFLQIASGTLLASSLTASAFTIPALASPEFTRTEEEWATLRDDNLEYDEIVDLVHEYNPTVIKNRIDLNEFRKDYGETNDEWADRYREIADDAESALDYPDSDDTSYAATMAGIISSEMQIKSLRETADDALEDYQVTYYNYCAQECQTASTAQSSMISYYLNQIQLESDQKNLELLQLTYDDTVRQEQAGAATSVDVLKAGENLKNGQKAIQDDESAIENVRQKLIVALGWDHSASPQIGQIPEVDEAFIASMNPSADTAAAVENSYSLKAEKKKLANAKDEDNIEDLTTTVREDEQNIGAAMTTKYQAVTAAQAAYDLAAAQAALEKTNLAQAEKQYQLGLISGMEYVTQQNTTDTAELAVQTARLNLFEAVENYRWMLNGLAGSDS